MKTVSEYRVTTLNKRDVTIDIMNSKYSHLPVNDKSLPILYRVFSLMERFKPIGKDDMRSIWMELSGKKVHWLRLTVGREENMTYIQVNFDGEPCMAVCDVPYAGCTREECAKETKLINAAPNLTAIEKTLVWLLDKIGKDTEAYNKFVEKKLNFNLRTGLIDRALYYQLVPQQLPWEGMSKEHLLELYHGAEEPTLYETMNLRTYMKVWRIAYEGVHAPLKKTDEEVFTRNSKGLRIGQRYELETEAGWHKWCDENSAYHCFDVVYARVSLSVVSRSWDEAGLPVGPWMFRLTTNSYWNLDDCFKALLALDNAGIHTDMSNEEAILAILEERDKVRFNPYAYRYMQEEGVGNEAPLPDRMELSAKVYNELVKNTVWDPIPKLELN